jgi:amino acid transporter
VNSGSLIALTGSLGGVIAYVVAGSVVACVLYTITEMVASRPLTGSLLDLPHTFLDPAFGFAVGVSYTYSTSLI